MYTRGTILISAYLLLCCWLHCLGGICIYMEKSAESEQEAIDMPCTIAIGDPLIPSAVCINSIQKVESQIVAGDRSEPDRLTYSIVRFKNMGLQISTKSTKDHLIFLRRLII